jgi:serine/threonine-protein kinase
LWSPDGRILSIHQHPDNGPVSIFLLPMDQPNPKPEPFPVGGFNAESATFSRDGKYVAFISVESGQREIYIRPYPGPGAQVSVSVGGGEEPIWARNGDLFYRSLDDDRTFSVAVTTTPTLTVGVPKELPRRAYYASPTGSPRAQYDVTADGRRLLVIAESEDAASGRRRLVVVRNWAEELKRLVPVR